MSDSADTAFRIKALTWSAVPMLLGGYLGILLAHRHGLPPVPTALLLGGVFWATAYVLVLFVAGYAGRVGSGIYMSSRSRLPVRREYSLAESLVSRGRADDAALLLEQAVAEHATEAEPCLRLARLLRDHRARHEDAARWFRVALERERNEAVRLGVRRELVELLIHRMGEPQRALPELARIADGHAGTPAGAWAKAEMADIRQRMRSGQDHG